MFPDERRRALLVATCTSRLRGMRRAEEPTRAAELVKRNRVTLPMRKEIVSHSASVGHEAWLDLEANARVRLTSEDPSAPIEAALRQEPPGWRATQAGPQTIVLEFDAPQTVHEIYLRFDVAETRTQEFVLSASTEGGLRAREIVRQQFNFSPATTPEEEHYSPNLSGVTRLELTLIPDISGGSARASLHALAVR